MAIISVKIGSPLTDYSYVDNATAAQMNLTYASSSKAVLKVDTSENDASTGRKSVRITSKNTYDDGLFIFDVVRSPYGCATWPALWLSDPSNWPSNGEIDVMEAVNTATDGNQMTLHTTNGCKMDRKRKETGTVLTKNCYNGTDDNAGCGVQGKTATFGEEFNTNGGGVRILVLASVKKFSVPNIGTVGLRHRTSRRRHPHLVLRALLHPVGHHQW